MRFLLCMIAAATVTGCATTAYWQATGGSRADGVVRLSYEYTMFQDPSVDHAAGLVLARQRCRVWGYSDAEPFGGETRTCNSYNGYGCAGWLVTKEYQCTGSAAAPAN